jgi:hypothetical protein
MTGHDGHSIGEEALPDRSIDELLALLDDPQRQHVIRCLHHAPTPAALDDLAACLVVSTPAEADQEADPRAPFDHARARAALHHVHLPRLADAGLVEYDADDCAITATDSAGLSALLELRATIAGASETRTLE